MLELLQLAPALIWLAGAWARVYRLARFYQIEEYMNRRFLRWQAASWRRLIPPRSATAWLAGWAMAWLAAADSSSAGLSLALSAAALIAVYPPRAGEIKRGLVLTDRLKRMLAASTLLCGLALVALLILGERVPAFARQPGMSASAGALVFLLAPLWLVAGNFLAQPVEETLRRRYLRQAAATLGRIDPTVIGITGSYGKTTTKHFLREIMSARYQTYATPQSYNTLMGISLAINRDLAEDYRTEYFISEMGAYVEGEIARICQLTPPDIAIVTEVGPQHLERFGSLENVKRAKYELIKSLGRDGVAVLNWDNPYIREMAAAGHPGRIIAVSRQLSLDEAREQGVDWLASEMEPSLRGLRFRATHLPTGESALLETPVLGAHNASNLLLCIAAARHEGVAMRDIVGRVRGLQPAESRLALSTTASGVTIINDAYSANPQGIVSALQTLGMNRAGGRLLITPGMIELGELQETENRRLGKLAAQHATDIILVGAAQTKPILEGIQSASFDMRRARVVDSLSEAVDWYRENLSAGDAVLFLNDLPDTY